MDEWNSSDVARIDGCSPNDDGCMHGWSSSHVGWMEHSDDGWMDDAALEMSSSIIQPIISRAPSIHPTSEELQLSRQPDSQPASQPAMLDGLHYSDDGWMDDGALQTMDEWMELLR